jgi:hypothetical protein
VTTDAQRLATVIAERDALHNAVVALRAEARARAEEPVVIHVHTPLEKAWPRLDRLCKTLHRWRELDEGTVGRWVARWVLGEE